MEDINSDDIETERMVKRAEAECEALHKIAEEMRRPIDPLATTKRFVADEEEGKQE